MQAPFAPVPVSWLTAWRRYLAAVLLGNVVWELAQLPLYTLWQEQPLAAAIAAAAHCVLGDLLIASAALLLALVTLGSAQWPQQGFLRVAVATVILGVGYTVFSEWLNLSVRQSWAYSALMPRLPILGTGLSPLLQWLVVPALALCLAARRTGAQQRKR